MICRICGNSELNKFEANEMMLGTREAFEYAQCSACLTIQIVTIPRNLADYYPSDYYSFQLDNHSNVYGKLKAKLIIKRDLAALKIRPSLLGTLIQKMRPAEFDARYLASQFVYQKLIQNKDITIHDAGCGNGFFLQYFHDLGFKGISGSDPFLSKTISFGDYVVHNKNLEDLESTFDVILLNHVIEHVTTPVNYLKEVYKKLNPGGECLVRTPMSTCIGFEKYGTVWVGLEPPRHLHIFDQDYFRKMAESVGFECYAIDFDMLSWHNEASEAYQRNISLVEMEANPPFSQEELSTFRKQAAEANASKRGDTVAYYLKKK
jgi:SAM-dependent methyltransferase